MPGRLCRAPRREGAASNGAVHNALMARVNARPLRTRWKPGAEDRSLEEQAGALAFIIWRLAHETAINLHGEDFEYRGDGQRFEVIAECAAWLTHLVDRMAHGRLSDAERQTLIVALARRMAEHMQDNASELAGPGDYGTPFIAMLNERFEEFAGCRYEQGQPGYSLKRALGYHVMKRMGEDQTNKWVMDQIMDIEASEIHKKLQSAMEGLLSSGRVDLTPPSELEDHRPVQRRGAVMDPG
jgi:hypothetical protein